jgi:transketolase
MPEATSYGEFLRDAGSAHPEIVVLDAGLATSMQTSLFEESFPDRYLNLGIAEQNAVGVAAGLARRGLVPLLHTFSNFMARRAHDQVALSVAWPGCNVKLIGGSCGVFDGRNGPSHMAVDDLAVMASLPGMTVVEPGDQRQTSELLNRIVTYVGPAYLRLRRNGAPADLLPGSSLGAGVIYAIRVENPRCTLVAGGSMLGEALLAAKILADRGFPVDLLHVAILQPLDAAPILDSARRSGVIVTVENHNACGGFGDAVARATGAFGFRYLRLNLPEEFIPAGESGWQLRYSELDADSIAFRVALFLSGADHV